MLAETRETHTAAHCANTLFNFTKRGRITELLTLCVSVHLRTTLSLKVVVHATPRLWIAEAFSDPSSSYTSPLRSTARLQVPGCTQGSLLGVELPEVKWLFILLARMSSRKVQSISTANGSAQGCSSPHLGSISQSVCLSIRPSVRLSVHLSTHPSIHPSF